VPPPEKMPHTVGDVVIHRPACLAPRAVGKVVRSPAHDAIELPLHRGPWRLVARSEHLPDAPLDPHHRFLAGLGPQIPVPILPRSHRPKGVAVPSGSWAASVRV
jgi:hypothetical protein